MALVRILIDGYSLLHSWPELAPSRPRHSAAAREALLGILTQYRDAIGTPITVVFDGGGAPPGTPKLPTTRELEVLYSKAGQTADQMIERAAYRFRTYGEVLVITNDIAERDTVIGMGGMAQSCECFLAQIGDALDTLDLDVREHNRRERAAFRRNR
ncbi:MAG: NYN domain-containing protein [Verrucomicrobia bacterium]|nr:NYN domain-containing protein [Verrucomicrobiota bacterium]